LNKPTTLVKCFDDKSADETVSFISDMLYFIAEGTL